MAMLNYEDVNKEVQEIIHGKIQKFLEDGQRAYDSGLIKDTKAIDDTNAYYVLEADYERYCVANDFRTLFEFSGKYSEEELYEIPGMKVGEKKFPLIIPISLAGKIAEKAHNIEKKLEFMGVKFPAQLYQLLPKYKGENLPGYDFPAPEPKRVSQTDDEYEKYLEEYYKTHGVSKSSDGASFRNKYPHEQINYGKENKIDKDFDSEYYKHQLERAARGKGTSIPAPTGERIKVTSVEAGDPSLEKDADPVKRGIKRSKVYSAVVKIAAFAAGVLGAHILFNATPTGWAIVGTAGAVFALTMYIKKKFRQRRLRREIEEEAEKEAKKKAEEEAKKGKDKSKTLDDPTKGTTGKGKDDPDPTKGTGTPDPVVPDPTKKTGTGTPDPVVPDPTKKTGADTPDPDKKFVFDHDRIYDGEKELAFDNAAFRNINMEINKILIELEPLKETTDPAKKPELERIKARLNELYQKRMDLIERIMERQQILMEDMGLSSRKR